MYIKVILKCQTLLLPSDDTIISEILLILESLLNSLNLKIKTGLAVHDKFHPRSPLKEQ